MRRIKFQPPHCLKCHATWWMRKYDWNKEEPLETELCPICRNDWRTPDYVVQVKAPKIGDEDTVMCECPVCRDDRGYPQRFLIRRSWLKRQQAACDFKYGQDKFLPRPLEDQEKESA